MEIDITGDWFEQIFNEQLKEINIGEIDGFTPFEFLENECPKFIEKIKEHRIKSSTQYIKETIKRGKTAYGETWEVIK